MTPQVNWPQLPLQPRTLSQVDWSACPFFQVWPMKSTRVPLVPILLSHQLFTINQPQNDWKHHSLKGEKWKHWMECNRHFQQKWQLQFLSNCNSFLLKAPLKPGFVTFYHTTTIFWEGRRDLPHPTIKPAVVVGLGSHHSGRKRPHR